MIFEKYGVSIECPDTDRNPIYMKNVLYDIYEEHVYDFFDVRGKDVLDIGAYCGETAIYFSKNGARNVIAVEPFDTYSCISKNVERNNCDNITALNAALCKKGYEVEVSSFSNNADTSLKDKQMSVNRYKIPSYTLDEIAYMFDLEDAILKMDCEGSEEAAISDSSIETLRKFSGMMIEIHKTKCNWGTVVSTIKEAGFYISHTNFNRPDDTFMLYAIRV
jgi:FkbM family methyltransferase